MLEKEMRNILKFFGFESQHIVDLDYLIKQSDKLDVDDRVHEYLRQFDPRSDESYPIFYKRMFFTEITWRIVELVCVEKHPDVAIGHLEDFCLYFHDIWTNNEDDNVFYNWLGRVDMRDMTVKEIVDTHYEDLSHIYSKYFEDGQERLFAKGLK